MIRAIIFDCFGVLTADSWHEFRTELPIDLQGPASELNHRYCSGSISKKDFLASVAELTGQTEHVIEQVFADEKNKNYPLLGFIAELKSDYKIGLISNVASDFIRESLLTPDEQEMFDTFVFSYEEHMIKPDPEIYKLAAERLGVRPEECVFIDDLEPLAMGAQRVGMKTIVYKNLTQMKLELDRILSLP